MQQFCVLLQNCLKMCKKLSVEFFDCEARLYCVTVLVFVSRRWTFRRKRWSTSCLWRLVPYYSFIKSTAELIKGNIALKGWGEWKERPIKVKFLDRKTGSRCLPYSLMRNATVFQSRGDLWDSNLAGLLRGSHMWQTYQNALWGGVNIHIPNFLPRPCYKIPASL